MPMPTFNIISGAGDMTFIVFRTPLRKANEIVAMTMPKIYFSNSEISAHFSYPCSLRLGCEKEAKPIEIAKNVTGTIRYSARLINLGTESSSKILSQTSNELNGKIVSFNLINATQLEKIAPIKNKSEINTTNALLILLK